MIHTNTRPSVAQTNQYQILQNPGQYQTLKSKSKQWSNPQNQTKDLSVQEP